MFRFILFLLLLASAQLSFGIEQQTGPIKITIISESQRLKLLVAAYDSLSDAIAADDLSTVEKLFNEHPSLKQYAHHNEGTPLHFARSLAMAQLLTEKLGFNPNTCDEWGELPSMKKNITTNFPISH